MKQEILDDAFWSNSYITHTDAWDIGHVSPPMKAYIDQLTNKKISILIPGCGNAYEAKYLLDAGFTNITLIDISHVLVAYLQQQFQNTPVKIIHGNFFNHYHTYDLILEQTFFCAINPALRTQYATHMKTLLTQNGKVAGVLFNDHFNNNPPYGGNKAEYDQLFSPLFYIKTLQPCYNSIIPRRDRELFFILKS